MLLGHADGLEVGLTGWVHVHPHRTTASQCPDHHEVLVDLDPAELASSRVMDHRDDLVARVHDLLELNMLGLEALLPRLDKAAFGPAQRFLGTARSAYRSHFGPIAPARAFARSGGRRGQGRAQTTSAVTVCGIPVTT